MHVCICNIMSVCLYVCEHSCLCVCMSISLHVCLLLQYVWPSIGVEGAQTWSRRSRGWGFRKMCYTCTSTNARYKTDNVMWRTHVEQNEHRLDNSYVTWLLTGPKCHLSWLLLVGVQRVRHRRSKRSSWRKCAHEHRGLWKIVVMLHKHAVQEAWC